jgi:hypothetical protein
LKEVDFTDNVCLSQRFEGDAMTTMPETVTNACKFSEKERDVNLNLISITESTPIKENCCSSLTSQYTNFTSSIFDTISKFDSELKSCKSQVDSIKGIYDIQIKELREEVLKLSREREAKQT